MTRYTVVVYQRTTHTAKIHGVFSFAKLDEANDFLTKLPANLTGELHAVINDPGQTHLSQLQSAGYKLDTQASEQPSMPPPTHHPLRRRDIVVSIVVANVLLTVMLGLFGYGFAILAGGLVARWSLPLVPGALTDFAVVLGIFILFFAILLVVGIVLYVRHPRR